ncbi:MAG: serpin family protein [Planctomycetota bacterium]|jgi:serpin B
MKRLNLIILVTLIFSFTGICCSCTGAGEKERPAVPVGRLMPYFKASIDASNSLAFDIYGKLKGDSGNIFFSPVSISGCLSMAYAGAAGETAAGMKKALSIKSGGEDFFKGMTAIHAYMNGKREKPELSMANALWLDKKYSFKNDYLEKMGECFGAEQKNMDFAGDPGGAVEEINEWVDENTRGKIKEILSEGAVNPETRLVLTNAVYFKGMFKVEFDPEDTRPGDFHVTQDKTTKANMMNMWDESFRYHENDELKVLCMPYKGALTDRFELIIILPKEGTELSVIEEKLSQENINKWIYPVKPQEIERVSIPKFKMTYSTTLREHLESLGMESAFDGKTADFSGIDGTQDLFISDVYHKAFVSVDEKGTEAAAATAAPMESEEKMDYKVFIADRPFIFMIFSRDTGAILFMGRILNPNS